jgi:hypothetical protein
MVRRSARLEFRLVMKTPCFARPQVPQPALACRKTFGRDKYSAESGTRKITIV